MQGIERSLLSSHPLDDMVCLLQPFIEDTRQPPFTAPWPPWNEHAFKNCVLYFPAHDVVDGKVCEVRFRYAALNNPTWRLEDGLRYAIERCLPFRILSPVTGTPRVTVPLRADPVLAHHVDLWQFVQQWRSKVQTLLQSPHSRAFVSMGGIEARLAIELGGTGYLQRVLSHSTTEGPRTISRVINGQEYTDDTVTPGEVKLLLGTLLPQLPIRKVERSLWPSTEVLRLKFSESYRGEWNDRCETLFQVIWNQVNSDKPKLRDKTKWRTFFEYGSRVNQPLARADSQVWLDAYNKVIAVDGKEWHGCLVTDLYT